MNSNYFLNELRHGVSPETLSFLLEEAVLEYEKEKAIKLAPLADGIEAYIGADHPLFNDWTKEELAHKVAIYLEPLVLNYDDVCCTEEKCSCGEDCSCEEKIVEKPIENKKIIGKVTTFKDGVKTEKELTEDEVDNIFATWLKRIG